MDKQPENRPNRGGKILGGIVLAVLFLIMSFAMYNSLFN